MVIGKDEIDEIKFVKIADPSRSLQSTPIKTPTTQSTSRSKSPVNKSPIVKPTVYNYESKHQKSTKPIPNIPIRSTFNLNQFAPSSNSLSQHQSQGSKIKSKKHNFKNQAFDDAAVAFDEDEILGEDFDFEGNLALFDKKEIFKEIDNENIFGIKSNSHKPDLVRQLHKQEEKYRHDENVLDSMLVQFKNVQLEFKPKQEYTTDEPYIVIPSIPGILRNRISSIAVEHGTYDLYYTYSFNNWLSFYLL